MAEAAAATTEAKDELCESEIDAILAHRKTFKFSHRKFTFLAAAVAAS